MADEQSSKEIDSLAFEIYSKRVSSQQASRGGEQVAIDSYRQAEAFLAVRKKMRGGEIKARDAETSVLCDCCAPNLDRNHPHNLVARLYTDRKRGGVEIPGDLNKVKRIAAWLDKNPTPESDPEELVAKLNNEFRELNWDQTTINTARAVLPAYCKN